MAQQPSELLSVVAYQATSASTGTTCEYLGFVWYGPRAYCLSEAVHANFQCYVLRCYSIRVVARVALLHHDGVSRTGRICIIVWPGENVVQDLGYM